MSLKSKFCSSDSSFICAAGKSCLEGHAKIDGHGVEIKENEVADDIDYDADNKDINHDFGN